jgi:hypothetical protein
VPPKQYTQAEYTRQRDNEKVPSGEPQKSKRAPGKTDSNEQAPLFEAASEKISAAEVAKLFQVRLRTWSN